MLQNHAVAPQSPTIILQPIIDYSENAFLDVNTPANIINNISQSNSLMRGGAEGGWKHFCSSTTVIGSGMVILWYGNIYPPRRLFFIDTILLPVLLVQVQHPPGACVCVFFPFILDIKFVGRTCRGHTGGRSHRIFHPPSFCGACLSFSREKDSVIPFPRRP